MYSILIHLNGQCVSEGGSKKSAENGFMTGGGCNSSSSRGIMSPMSNSIIIICLIQGPSCGVEVGMRLWRQISVGQVNIDLVKLPAYKHLSCLDQWPNKTNIDCNYHIVKNLYKETQNQNQYEPISKLLTPLRTAHVRFSAT
ncbi:hypothetical protein YC2023_036462 [Brassica napus]